MKSNLLMFPVLAAGLLAPAGAQTPAPTKVGVVDIQSAILQTKDGQKATADLRAKFTPKEQELAKLQNDIQQKEETYRKGANAMSEEAKASLAREIDSKQKLLQRSTDDAKADLDAEQQKVMGELWGKMNAILSNYANKNGFMLVLDVSNPQTPVVFASNTIEITRDLIALYDQNAANMQPAGPSTSAPPSASPTSTPPTSTSKAPPPSSLTTPKKAPPK